MRRKADCEMAHIRGNGRSKQANPLKIEARPVRGLLLGACDRLAVGRQCQDRGERANGSRYQLMTTTEYPHKLLGHEARRADGDRFRSTHP
jgi:hypothetical protein